MDLLFNPLHVYTLSSAASESSSSVTVSSHVFNLYNKS